MSYAQLFDFTGKRVLVTGAASGIGEAIARGFAGQGATLLVADRDEPALRAVADDLGPACRVRVYDQSDLASVEALAEASGDIDVLVNNAGILVTGPLVDLDWEELRRLVDIDLVGPIALTQRIGAAMVARGSGNIINIGSQLVFNGARHRSAYASAKAGLTQFTRTAALEWGEFGVRVNCLAPGKTVTNLNRHLLADRREYEAGLVRTPLKRYGEPRDVANAALFMASDAASYITGHTLVIDGGWILE